MRILYVMCGIPGSGKTTLSKQMAEEQGLVRVSYDELRCYRQNDFIRPAIDALHEDKSVIMDATNLRVSGRKYILQAMTDIQCKKVLVFMDTPLEECIHRNATRNPRLTDGLIESSYRALQPPTLEEGWDEVMEVKP